uniref:MPBQ/MBSQ family SAM-binding methyltransferase profile domain-containing protein n=1 Tax=Setaria viridis TaxID=4556 RepID=A0A4U6V903_SETVI|nr:hypothetical protein SEVIR_4G293501v2 [Setaria viridis]
MEGDAEDLPIPTDTFDRHIFASSIEYWAELRRGIKEAYRVLRFGGLACEIGPMYPTFWLSCCFVDMWLLFPKEGTSSGSRRLGSRMSLCQAEKNWIKVVPWLPKAWPHYGMLCHR